MSSTAHSTEAVDIMAKVSTPPQHDPPMHYLFSFGSNGLSQICARVGADMGTLKWWPAHVDNYVRVFCMTSKGWGGGGVATIVPCETTESSDRATAATTSKCSDGSPHDSRVYGCVCMLTDAQMRRMDQFEGGYQRSSVLATLYVPLDAADMASTSDMTAASSQSVTAASTTSSSVVSTGRSDDKEEHSVPAMDGATAAARASHVEVINDSFKAVRLSVTAYVAKRPAFRQPPTQPYLVAIHNMLRQTHGHTHRKHRTRQGWTSHAPHARIPITRLRQEAKTVEVVDHWSHPGHRDLELPALMYALGTHHTHEQPWTMPITIWDVVDQLAEAGVTTTKQLCDIADRGLDELLKLNSKLKKPLTEQEVRTLHHLLTDADSHL